MKRFEVLLTEDAGRDLEEMLDYVAEHDGLSRATYVLDRIGEALANLATFPERAPIRRSCSRSVSAIMARPSSNRID